MNGASTGVLAVLATFAMTGAAQAQATAAAGAGPDAATAITEVVVTSSRVNRAGFTAPTPVSVLSGQDLALSAATNIGQALNELPAFHADQTPTTNTFTRTGAGQNVLDLRSLGSTRTLVLVDGRRFVPTGNTGTTDLNLIPTSLIDRAEVVTGGASADWGSDAVAGVVNLILKKSMDGFSGQISGSEADRGDARDYLISLAGGRSFAGGKGQVIGGFDYANTGMIGDIYSRDWGRKEYGLIVNPTPGANGQPANIISPNVHFSTYSLGGMVQSGPLKGLVFLPGGATGQFNYGQVFGNSQIGGDQYGLTPYRYQLLRVPVQRLSSMVRASYDFGDHLSGFVQATYAKSSSQALSGGPRDITPVTISITNAYLPASVVAQLQANKLTSLSVERYSTDFPITKPDATDFAYEVTAGLNGDLGAWKWDAYYQYGYNNLAVNVVNNRIQPNYLASINAVVNPANGQIVCASTLTSPSNGCAPMNYFGAGSPSAASIAYDFATSLYRIHNTQQVAAAELKGEPVTLWAGPVSLVVGAEYRSESATSTTDAGTQAGIFNLALPLPSQGSFNVQEFYGETVVPLASHAPFVKSLDFNGAIRQTHYSTSGWVTTWKAGFSYKPLETDDLLLRVTNSRDVRAPNLAELFTAQSSTNATVTNPWARVSALTPVIAQGNTKLIPEVSSTLTYGVALQPHQISGLRLSVDWYQISVTNVIAQFGQQNIVNQCFAGVTQYCALVTGAGSSSITAIYNQFLNLNALKVAGLDIEAEYRLTLSSLNSKLPGALALHVMANNVRQLDLVSGLGVTTSGLQLSGGTGGSVAASGAADWIVRETTTYRLDPVTLSATIRYIDKGIYNTTMVGPGQAGYSPSLPNSVNNNSVPAFTYVDLSAEYALSRTFQVFGGINNLFDVAPPPVPTGASLTNGTLYDVVGRSFRMGVRFKH